MSEYNIPRKALVINSAKIAYERHEKELKEALLIFGRNNPNCALQIIFDPRYEQDLDMLFEYKILQQLFNSTLGVSPKWNDNGECYGQFVLSHNPTYLNQDNSWYANGVHKIARYGYLDSDIFLHMINAMNNDGEYNVGESIIEPSVNRYDMRRYQWSYWCYAMWVEKLMGHGLTPKTWFNKGYATVPDCEHGWVVKGTLKSMRQDWNCRMFADTRETLALTMNRLYDDTFVSKYGLMIREYLPLMPIGELHPDEPAGYRNAEYRVHIYQDQVIEAFYYWDTVLGIPVPDEVIEFALRCYKVAEYDGWASVDVAYLKGGGMTCIEMNCGPISGIGDPVKFWISYLKNYKTPKELEL